MKFFPQILQAESEPEQSCSAGGPELPGLQTQLDVHLQVSRLDWLLRSGRRGQGRLAGFTVIDFISNPPCPGPGSQLSEETEEQTKPQSWNEGKQPETFQRQERGVYVTL